MPVTDPTQRFSSRVDNYVRYRPDYPAEVLGLLKKECGLTSESVVADIASGTGIWTRWLLSNGNRVYGVEPNAEMRKAGEEFLKSYPRFTSVAGTAETTTLADHSVDLVTAAQAAHWFDRPKARREFLRILKPGGSTALLWNERLTNTTPFLRAYEEMLLKYGTDYKEVRHERTTAEIRDFFAPAPYRREQSSSGSRDSITRELKDGYCLRRTLRNPGRRITTSCSKQCAGFLMSTRWMGRSCWSTTRGCFLGFWIVDF